MDTVGVDETAFLAATALSGTRFATGVVALNGRARLLDVVEGRSGTALCAWVSGRSQAWRRDSCGGVGPVPRLRDRAAHQPAERHPVLDAFHVVRLGFDALDQVRRHVQRDTLDHRGHRDDPLFRIRRRRLQRTTEAVNGLIKKIKRVGHGYRNFTNYRLRLLLHCGVTWHTPAVTPIRGRLPRLAA
jgi:transposase